MDPEFFPLLEQFIELIIGAVVAFLVYLAKKGYTRYRLRNLLSFWRPFIGRSLSIVFTQYPTDGSDFMREKAEIAGGRYLVSEGMTFSIAELKDFSQEYLSRKVKARVVGDKVCGKPDENIILLGSPEVNRHSKSLYELVASMYTFPYEMKWDHDGFNKRIVTKDQVLIPDVKSATGHDYALVIKCSYYDDSPNKKVIMVFGCHMWGTQAAAEALTNRKLINAISRETGNAENIIFLVKTRIVNSHPIGPELMIDGRYFIEVLKRRTSPQSTDSRMADLDSKPEPIALAAPADV